MGCDDVVFIFECILTGMGGAGQWRLIMAEGRDGTEVMVSSER